MDREAYQKLMEIVVKNSSSTTCHRLDVSSRTELFSEGWLFLPLMDKELSCFIKR